MEIKRSMPVSFVVIMFVFFLSGTGSAADLFTAACCLQDGSCRQTTETECIYLGGEFQKFGADCATFDCPKPLTAACCLQDGSCRQTTETECIYLGGEFQKFGADCATFDCPKQR